MSDSTDKLSRAKQDFYSRPEIANAYDEQRFGGASGAWVSAREIELVLELLPPFRGVLDLGCGTGRLSRALATSGAVVGLDTSAAMLAAARRENPARLVQGDAFRLPFADASFDAVVALRLAFHFRELGPLLREARRVLRPGDVIVFDTYAWSPRAWLPLDAERWGGGGVYPFAGASRTRGARVRLEGGAAAGVLSLFALRLSPPAAGGRARVGSSRGARAGAQAGARVLETRAHRLRFLPEVIQGE